MNKLGLLLKGGYKPYSKKRKNFSITEISCSMFCNRLCRYWSCKLIAAMFSEHLFICFVYFKQNLLTVSGRQWNFDFQNNENELCSSDPFGLREGEVGTLVFFETWRPTQNLGFFPPPKFFLCLAHSLRARAHWSLPNCSGKRCGCLWSDFSTLFSRVLTFSLCFYVLIFTSTSTTCAEILQRTAVSLVNNWTWVMPSCIAHWELVYMLSWKCRCRLAFHQVKRPTICLKRHWTGYVMLHWHGCSFWHLRLNM